MSWANVWSVADEGELLAVIVGAAGSRVAFFGDRPRYGPNGVAANFAMIHYDVLGSTWNVGDLLGEMIPKGWDGVYVVRRKTSALSVSQKVLLVAQSQLLQIPKLEYSP